MSHTLGHYELLIRLAAGGGANVFLARDNKASAPGRLVALKVILPELVSVPNAVRAFYTEAKIAARLRHPNIVGIAGFGETDGIYGLAMEYVFGVSLAELLNTTNRLQTPLTVCAILRMVADICGALHYAHDLCEDDGTPMNLVHRDISPENILIGFDGVPMLTDFGIAKVTNRGWQTQAGILKGKSRYMSPEQLLAKRLDRRSDVFLLGIVLWESLTGRPLFTGASVSDIFKAIGQRPIPTPSEVCPGLPPVIDGIVMNALRRVPSQRYPSARAMKQAIDDLLAQADVTVTPQSIASELASVFGGVIEGRAHMLRHAMNGKTVDVVRLANLMGGEPLNESQLPKSMDAPEGDAGVLFRRGAVKVTPAASPGVAAKTQAVLHSLDGPTLDSVPAEPAHRDPGAELQELMQLEAASVIEDTVSPDTPVDSGWQDQNETIDDRTAPFLLFSAEQVRAYIQRTPVDPAEGVTFPDTTLDEVPTSLDNPRVVIDGPRHMTAVRKYVMDATDQTIDEEPPVGTLPMDRELPTPNAPPPSTFSEGAATRAIEREPARPRMPLQAPSKPPASNGVALKPDVRIPPSARPSGWPETDSDHHYDPIGPRRDGYRDKGSASDSSRSATEPPIHPQSGLTLSKLAITVGVAIVFALGVVVGVLFSGLRG